MEPSILLASFSSEREVWYWGYLPAWRGYLYKPGSKGEAVGLHDKWAWSMAQKSSWLSLARWIFLDYLLVGRVWVLNDLSTARALTSHKKPLRCAVCCSLLGPEEIWPNRTKWCWRQNGSIKQKWFQACRQSSITHRALIICFWTSVGLAYLW